MLVPIWLGHEHADVAPDQRDQIAPDIRHAAAFADSMMPRSSIVMIASTAVSTTARIRASASRIACSARRRSVTSSITDTKYSGRPSPSRTTERASVAQATEPSARTYGFSIE